MGEQVLLEAGRGPGGGVSCFEGGEAVNVDRDRREDVLEVCLVLAPVTAAAGTVSVDGLVDGPLVAGAGAVDALPGWIVLLGPVAGLEFMQVTGASRSRKSPSTLWWKPGSSNSIPSAYLTSMRQRTASAASRSDQPWTNCCTQTPGRPSRGYQGAKSSSVHKPSSRSRIHMAAVPFGLLARAARAVASGIAAPGHGRTDIRQPRRLT
jgi:hypothetical protein